MTDYYREAIDQAVESMEKPLVDLTPEEVWELRDRVFDRLVEWGVFRLVDGGLRAGPRILAANEAYAETRVYDQEADLA